MADQTPNGRKYRMALFCIASAIAGFIGIVFLPKAGEYYHIFLGGLATFFAIYCGGNVGTKFVYSRPSVQIVQDRRQDPADPPSGPGSAETGYLQGVP